MTIYPVTAHTNHVGLGSTFVAIPGYKQHGDKYIEEAIARGATTIVVDRSANIDLLSLMDRVGVHVVSDCRKALAEMAARAWGYPAHKLNIIGITGTKGKTTTAFLVDHLLRCAGHTTALLSSIENRIGDEVTPSSLTTPGSDYLHAFFAQCVDVGVTHVVMEVSSHALALHRVHGVMFDAVGFTNLAPEHMDFHPSMDDYFVTKTQLFSHVKADGHIVINTDMTWGEKAATLCQEKHAEKNTTVYTQPAVHAEALAGITVTLPGGSQVPIPSLVGAFNGSNVYMAWLLCKALGVEEEKMVASLPSFPGVPGRLQLHRLGSGAHAVVDFAHEPFSFKSVLQTLRPLTDHLLVVFGCGGERDTTKRPEMGRLAAEYADLIFVTDDNPRGEDPHEIIKAICQGVPPDRRSRLFCIPGRGVAIAKAVEFSRKNSIIAVLGKGHESYYLCNGKRHRFNDFEELQNY